MIEALRFPQSSPKLVAPPISAGLPNGLVLQLWIRRTLDQTRQSIVELSGATSRIVLGTGARPDVLSLAVVAGDKITEISVAGAMPMARWVQVRAIVDPDGTAELRVLGMTLAHGKLPAPGSEARTLTIGGGLVGELTQLQVWKHSKPMKLTYDPPDLTAGNLWAYYPLAALEWDAASKMSVAKDLGPNRRHAGAQGTTNLPTRIVHDEPLDWGQAAHLRFVSNTRMPNLGPLVGLSGRLTMEAWICPDTWSAAPIIQLHGNDGRLVLVAGGPEHRDLALLSIGRPRKEPLLQVTIPPEVTVLARFNEGLQANQWSHVAVTLAVESVMVSNQMVPQLTISLFLNGRRRAQKTEWIVGNGVIRAASMIQSALVPAVTLGGVAPNYPRYCGGMAEVRIWAGASQERVEALWLARARGDEKELLACYRLDTDTSKPLVDISPRRGFARAPAGTNLQREHCPPLAATSGELAFRVEARGKLVREQLTRANLGAGTLSLQVTAKATNTLIGASVASQLAKQNVFDATIQVTSRSGNSPIDRTLEVRLDEPLDLLQVRQGQLVKTPWAANQTHSIPLPASGRVRLRFAAKQLACPTLRLRIGGTPGCVWTIVRPDEFVQGKLRGTTAQSLKSPSDGRRSPLPAGTSDEDAQALADALGQLGTLMLGQPRTSNLSASAKGIGDVLDDVGDVIDDAGDVAEDAYDSVVGAGEAVVSTGQDLLAGATTVAKSAGNLIVRGTEELEALVAKCAKASAWVGEQAIATAIASADRLAFVGAQSWDGVGRWVEVVGTSIVNGVEVAWRVIVSGVEDALAAVTQLIQRIAAKIKEWIDYLAWLLIWEDFLEASDEALEVIEGAMRGAGQQIAGLDGLKQQFADALRGTVEDAMGKRSLADVFGIDIDASSETFEHLEYVQDHVQELFDAADLNWMKSALSEDTGIGPSEVVKAQAGELAKLQPFGNPSDVLSYLTTPLSELLASNDKLANGSPSIFDAVFEPIQASTAELLQQLDDAMYSRLSVPYVTDFIEEVILFGRKLTTARIIALMAAIPAVLVEKSSSGSSSTRSTIEIAPRSTEEISETEQERREHDQRTRWALWCVMAAGLVNTIVIGAKSVAERRGSSSDLVSFLQLISGSIGMFRGFILVGRVPAFTPSTRSYAAVNASAEMTAGLCSAFFGMQGLKEIPPTQTRTDWSTLETVIQTILGATVIISSSVALGAGELGDKNQKTAFGLRCASWMLALSVRVCEKLDDRDSSGRAKYVTMGLALGSFGVELAEAIHGNVTETDAQT